MDRRFMDLLEGAYTLTKGLQVTPIDHELVCVVTEDAEVELPVFIWDCLNRDFVDTYQYVDRYVKLKSRTSVQVEKWREVFEMCITSRLLLEVPNAEITFANARDPLALMRRQSSDNLVFVYQGDWVDTLGGVPPLEFLEQTGLLQNNIVMLRDATSQFYTNGVSVDLPSLEHLVGWQIAAKQMFNAKATYHAGSSAGAFGALLLGHRTRATKVWCFSLPMLEFNGIDLRELLARPNGATQYYLWYGAGNPRDTATALELARFEGVTTIPVDFDGHLLAHHLWGAKSLPRLLESGASAASAAPTQDDASRRRVAADEVRRIVQECTEQPIRLDSKLNETLDSLEIVACMAGIPVSVKIDAA